MQLTQANIRQGDRRSPSPSGRLRLEGELTEFRAADLRFILDEAKALFEAAGIPLSDPALGLLYDRTEGWAAGLRLAALSCALRPKGFNIRLTCTAGPDSYQFVWVALERVI